MANFTASFDEFPSSESLWLNVAAFSSSDKTKVEALSGFPIANAWRFFNKRWDFLQSNFDKGHELFSFKVLQHEVVAMSGANSRKVFFHDKTLNFSEGYRLLMGTSPDMKSIKVDAGEQEVAGFNKKLAKILRRDRIQDGKLIPTLFSDVNKRMETWGTEGQLNPFNQINTLVFQMTVRMASCAELAANYDDLDRMSKLYWKLEESATPVRLLLPWFPGKARQDKKEATLGLYNLIMDYITLRRNAEVPSLDAIDLLIAGGEQDKDIVAFVLSVIFAGVINTGMISCWTTIYLGARPEWKAQAVAEIQKLIDAHTNTTSTEPLHQRLSAIPISAWEDEMPVMESIVRETMRIVLNGTFLRRNVVDDMEVSGKKIPRGAFMTYSITDTHLNPEYYADPHKFDPSRFTGGSEQNRRRSWDGALAVAKLEVKMILALMLTRYEYSVVDASGAPTTALPKPDRNDIHQARPVGECFIRYQQVME
ncbi:cytochrome P450 [Athelia psychrophila]|uniref:Cytochrome P450 n=1 Tax=Athelia psychrophila TaxID=1759441 RepID=A0A166CZJ3_9AGAM|nr:cytochrome P450 [Fibularhizoctonia sp. CBS 109695]